MSAGTAAAVALPTDNVTLTGSATDDNLPAGSTLSYTWELVTGPTLPAGVTTAATIATPNATSTSVRFLAGAGDYTFRLRASDGELAGEGTVVVTVNPNTFIYPDPPATAVHGWQVSTAAEQKMDATLLTQAQAASSAFDNDPNPAAYTDAGMIIRNGRLVHSWTTNTDPDGIGRRYEMKSTTKSIGGLALLLALDDGRLALADKVDTKVTGGVFARGPTVDTTPVTSGGLADITVLQLATHSAGFSKSDLQTGDPRQLLFTPGTTWSYSDQGLNWLADTLTLAYQDDLSTLLNNRVLNVIGIRNLVDSVWRDNLDSRPNAPGVPGTLTLDNASPVARRELASGINANVNAMARIGYLMLRKGVWNSTSILSNASVAKVTTPAPETMAITTINNAPNFPNANMNYGILWWTNANSQLPGVPTDAFWGWGLHDTLIIVIPSLDLVVVRASNRSMRTDAETWSGDYTVLQPFLGPIVQSIQP